MLKALNCVPKPILKKHKRKSKKKKSKNSNKTNVKEFNT